MTTTKIADHLRRRFPNSSWDGRVGPLFVAAAAIVFVAAAAI